MKTKSFNLRRLSIDRIILACEYACKSTVKVLLGLKKYDGATYAKSIRLEIEFIAFCLGFLIKL